MRTRTCSSTPASFALSLRVLDERDLEGVTGGHGADATELRASGKLCGNTASELG